MEYKKLDDKIKDLKSTRVFKKVTPKYDLSWYVKWLSSVLILTAVCFRATTCSYPPKNRVFDSRSTHISGCLLDPSNL